MCLLGAGSRSWERGVDQFERTSQMNEAEAASPWAEQAVAALRVTLNSYGNCSPVADGVNPALPVA